MNIPVNPYTLTYYFHTYTHKYSGSSWRESWRLLRILPPSPHHALCEYILSSSFIYLFPSLLPHYVKMFHIIYDTVQFHYYISLHAHILKINRIIEVLAREPEPFSISKSSEPNHWHQSASKDSCNII